MRFPPVETANEDGLLAVGGNLSVENLIQAYKQGIFPWPISVEFPLAWFSPDPRGIIFTEKVHLPRSFEKWLKKQNHIVTFNQAFEEVIFECARMKRKEQAGTWITPEIINAYNQLFKKGHAYSVEVWREKKLIAGLYGVCLGNFFSGESMFSKDTNTSKLALYTLLNHLKNKGVPFLDTQMVTSVVASFGGEYIGRDLFMKLLSQLTMEGGRELFF